LVRQSEIRSSLVIQGLSLLHICVAVVYACVKCAC